MAFAALFPGDTSDAIAFNSPGFANRLMVNAVFSALGGARPVADQPLAAGAVITNVTSTEANNAGDSLEILAGVHGYPGTNRVIVPIENQWETGDVPDPKRPSWNHDQRQVTDSLALHQLLQRLDPTFTLDSMNPLVRAAASGDYRSFENIVDSLQRLLGVDTNVLQPGNNYDARSALHEAIQGLELNARIVAISGKVRIELSSMDLGARARNDFSALASLIGLSPIVLTATSTQNQAELDSTLQSAWGDTYAAWAADRSLSVSDRLADKATFSESWLADRATLLKALNTRNASDLQAPSAAVNHMPTDRVAEFLFTDPALGSKTVISAWAAGSGSIDRAIATRWKQRIEFGTDAPDPIIGTQNGPLADHLYGAGGNDTLVGLAGSDHLEGQADADILIGGAGSDTLLGGKGFDRYVFTAADLTDRTTDTVFDAGANAVGGTEGGRISFATSVSAEGVLTGEKTLELKDWVAKTPAPGSTLQQWTSSSAAGAYTLTAIGTNRWTLAGGALPQEATLALEAGNTLSLRFGKGGAAIRIQDWAPGSLGIELMGWTPPARSPADAKAAELRDLTLLQIAAGVDLYSVVGSGDAAALKAKLTATPSRNGTAERLTPPQADALLGRYDIVAQYGNDGAGFSATVFKRKAVTDPVTGVPLPGDINADPYVLAFRGNDLEPDRVGGVAKDGGLAELREINRYGFAWAQLDAMERFWAGLQQGKVLNRAPQELTGPLQPAQATAGAAFSMTVPNALITDADSDDKLVWSSGIGGGDGAVKSGRRRSAELARNRPVWNLGVGFGGLNFPRLNSVSA